MGLDLDAHEDLPFLTSQGHPLTPLRQEPRALSGGGTPSPKRWA